MNYLRDWCLMFYFFNGGAEVRNRVLKKYDELIKSQEINVDVVFGPDDFLVYGHSVGLVEGGGKKGLIMERVLAIGIYAMGMDGMYQLQITTENGTYRAAASSMHKKMRQMLDDYGTGEIDKSSRGAYNPVHPGGNIPSKYL